MQSPKDHSTLSILDILDPFIEQKHEVAKLLLFALDENFGITIADILFAIYAIAPERSLGCKELFQARTKLPTKITQIESGENYK